MKKQSLNILLVGDDANTRQQLLALISQLNDRRYSVATADCHEEALEAIGDRVFDMLLLQFALADTTADEWIVQLPVHITSHMAIIVLAKKYDDALKVMNCLDSGALDFISVEPFDQVSLINTIDTACESIQTQKQINNRIIIEEALTDALSKHELTLHYQPLIDAKSRQVVAAEALVRWQHPDLGSLSPAQFIPVAEDTGLIKSIGQWVLKTAFEQNNQWRQLGLFDDTLMICVNVSLVQLNSESFVDQLADLLCQPSINGQQLMIEITEETLMSNPQQMLLVLKQISALGIRIAIDDFGTGYTSLTDLVELPLYMIKIAPAFIAKIGKEEDGEKVIRAVIQLAHNMGWQVAAEGVETQQQVVFLADNGCDLIQGYFIERPNTPDQACHWLDRIDAIA